MFGQRKKVNFFCFLFLVVGGVAMIFLFYPRWQKKQARQQASKEQIAAEKIIATPTTAPAPPHSAAPSSSSAAPPAFRLAIPFVPQAPTKNWDADHEEYCEEAALLMADAFLRHKKLTIAEMETELAKMRDWEIAHLGFFESTSVAEVVQIAREYLNFTDVKVLTNPTREQIYAAAAAGQVVILPANGKELPNPYFKNGGPNYHMLVVRGFTETGRIITNDPGTQHGENFVYDAAALFAALHDWTWGQTGNKPAVGSAQAIVIK